jgi:hypothetical protein
MVRRGAFLSGLILGSSVCAWILGFVLIHLYTGKILALRLGGDTVLDLQLLDLSMREVSPLGRERVASG